MTQARGHRQQQVPSSPFQWHTWPRDTPQVPLKHGPLPSPIRPTKACTPIPDCFTPITHVVDMGSPHGTSKKPSLQGSCSFPGPHSLWYTTGGITAWAGQSLGIVDDFHGPVMSQYSLTGYWLLLTWLLTNHKPNPSQSLEDKMWGHGRSRRPQAGSPNIPADLRENGSTRTRAGGLELWVASEGHGRCVG